MQDKAESNNVIATFLTPLHTTFVEPAIFGTSNPDLIAEYVNTFCLSTLGSAIAEFLFYESGQGAVFGLRLSDCRRVVVKAGCGRLRIAESLILKQPQQAANGSITMHVGPGRCYQTALVKR